MRTTPRFVFGASARPALLLAALLAFGCGEPAPDPDPDAGPPPPEDAGGPADTGTPPACADGDRRCDGLELQRCADGAWATTETCELACDEVLGCASPPDECAVRELDAPVACSEPSAPADSFDPEVQWRFMQPDAQSGMPALVANMTDDNGDGVIDLCDTPDVIVTVVVPTSVPSDVAQGFIYVLDGLTGNEHFRVETSVGQITPAVGDVDGDGLPEIVTVSEAASYDAFTQVLIFEHDGTLKLTGDDASGFFEVGSVGLVDLEGDGDVEILIHNRVFDDQGRFLFQAVGPVGFRAGAVAADLDGDGAQEVLVGNAAYDASGALLWQTTDVPESGAANVALADLDEDGDPEIVVTHSMGITVLDHLGVTVRTLASAEAYSPATIQDFDGDGAPEIATASGGVLYFYDPDLTVVGMATVGSGVVAPPTGFDFLGDGTPEVAYVDSDVGGLFDSAGTLVRPLGASSYVAGAYPTIADIDNDGSAEVVLSIEEGGDLQVIVIRDAMGRWRQPRRIWNQYNYTVTSVLEDGTIPRRPAPSWTYLNAFRTNALLESGGVCDPLI